MHERSRDSRWAGTQNQLLPRRLDGRAEISEAIEQIAGGIYNFASDPGGTSPPSGP